MRPVARIAPLVFLSGSAALVYQVAWGRELRLVFGASTAATAAVLAIFMGGLGAGGLLLGGRADRHPTPLAFYARLEILAAAAAAITPLLIPLVRWLYVGAGGSAALGQSGGTLLRLALAALVLGPPTLLMGGTLPAATRAAARADDPRRRDLAVLYGANTLGAVAGATLSTFVLLEVFGTRLMLWLACLVNLLAGLLALRAARRLPAPPVDTMGDPLRVPHRNGVLGAAAVVGFAFLLMEVVWYRLLAPVLGGSSYTFGLVLAVALLGVGAGGAARALWGGDRPASLQDFAFTCGLTALCLALPFALGDRLAVLALLLRPLGGFGLCGLAAGWTVVASIVILPAALVSGWQFPLLVALLGEGGRRVGRDVALAYAWNTAGGILGSLAGGFGLVPALTAPGVWRATSALLALLGVAAALFAYRAGRSFLGLAAQALITAAAAALLLARGPTAAWRHSAIGAGREADVIVKATPRSLRDWEHQRRREVVWEADGVESSVALTQVDGYAFVVNGKVDGHVRGDAATQVMGGLIGAILHPHPTRALVIGLGTGSSAGWLGAVPTMDRVDVVEIEPAVVRVARASASINHDVLDNPKVHLHFGDAREALQVSRERYDVIFSEPSNPYRAGVASLFTQEFYRAAMPRLSDDGFFLQWLQAYEIDGRALRTAIATLASVFPVVEVWTTGPGDLVLVASRRAAPRDAAALRERLSIEPYRTALARAFRVLDLEGFLAHFVAGAELSRAILASDGVEVSTDDRPVLEFAFARGTTRAGLVDADLLSTARRLRLDRPAVTGGPVDWALVEDERLGMSVAEGRRPAVPPGAGADQVRRGHAYMRYVMRDPGGVIADWQAQPRAPSTLIELEMLGEAFAEVGDEQALPLISRLRLLEPIEADAMLARLRARQGQEPEAEALIVSALERYQSDPLPDREILRRALDEVALPLAASPAFAQRLFDLLRAPFALRLLEGDRQRARVDLALRLDFERLCVEALAPFEPDPPSDLLTLRARCYRAAGDPRAAAAQREVEDLVEEEGGFPDLSLAQPR